LSTTNPTELEPGQEPGRRGGKPANNRLSYGTALITRFNFTITFSFSTTDSLKMIYFALARIKLEHAFAAWNSVIITNPNKLVCMQIKFSALRNITIFQDIQYPYDNLLEKLNLLTLHYQASSL
jgi:hypothetical protein